jgi:hypothetical protein
MTHLFRAPMFHNAVPNHEIARVPRIIKLLAPSFLLKHPMKQMSEIAFPSFVKPPIAPSFDEHVTAVTIQFLGRSR